MDPAAILDSKNAKRVGIPKPLDYVTLGYGLSVNACLQRLSHFLTGATWIQEGIA